jgi:predicted TIM-barrel fold metal-dependent hydrolase
MPSDIAQHISQTPLCDTHEHLRSPEDWTERGPDVLSDLFGNYVTADLVTAGASWKDVERLTDSSDPDLEGRFEATRSAWEATRFTGYGEAARILAREVYGLEEVTMEGILAAQNKLDACRTPEGRLRLLRESANLDHVQIDNFCWPCEPESVGTDFFLYDLSWLGFCNGEIHPNDLLRETGVEATDLETLRAGQEALFARYGPYAIAVKSQHAYNRTLDWRERTDADAAQALAVLRERGEAAPSEARLCLGDWSMARGVEQAIEHRLPFKIHTGYYAGNWGMATDRIRTGQMFRLFQRYPEARFVLMHIAYPYDDELMAMAKHFPNVWVDLCWAWSINPYASADFVRGFLHSVPINKLFAFGGDTMWPTSSLAYAHQARKGLTRALEAEIEAGDLSVKEAMAVADRIMRDNAYACFDVTGRREALKRRLATA